MRRLLLAALLFAAPASADSGRPPAALADTQLRDPAQERRARALMETLRCVVCEGQSIADSNAELAGDMRALVRERVRRGETPEAIRAWLIDRYGDHISYDPPFGPVTWLLWAAPVLLLVGGTMVARTSFGRRRG